MDYLWLFVVVNEPTSDSEVYLHLCVVDISIWTACDAYCELSVMDVMFIWMCYMTMTEPNKLIICGSFAECYTRQKSLLSSARVKTLGKVDTWQNYVHSGTKMTSLSSVYAMTLGKEAKILCILGRVCRVPELWHTAKVEALPSAWNMTHGKGRIFAECLNFDTRQRKKICRVPELWHSAKKHSLPSTWDLTLGKRAVTVSTPSHYFFRRASVSALGKIFAECPIENTRQRAICRHCRCHVLFARVLHSANPLPSVFWALPSACGTRQSDCFR